MALPPEQLQALPELKLLSDKWTLVGICFLADANDRTELDFIDLSTGRTHRIKVLAGSPRQWMGQMSISTGGKWLIYPQVDASATNLMMIDRCKGPIPTLFRKMRGDGWGTGLI